MDADLSAFLVHLSIALHKSAAYPSGHPLVAGAVDVAVKSLTQLLERRLSLSLGVARTQLIIDGEGTDPAHPVLRDLAQRLYRRQVGGVTFSPGVEPEEFTELLQAISAEGVATETDQLPQWPHVRLHPLALDQLRLADQGGDGIGSQEDGASSQLWADLVASALARPDGPLPEPAPIQPSALARIIDARAEEPEYVRDVTRQLLAFGHPARASEGAETRAVSRQLTELLGSLKPETLRRLLKLGPDRAQSQQLMLEMSRAMPVTAVIELVRASSEASEQTISHSLLRILTKLAAHAEAGAGEAGAAEALREMVRELVADWALKDPNPAGYSEMLERFSRTPGSGPRPAPKAVDVVEPLRLVQIALELGTAAPPVLTAVDTLVERGELHALLKLLAPMPADDPAAEAVWARLPLRDELSRVLEQDEPDPVAVNWLLHRLGLDAAEPLLDTLAHSSSRTTRRRLLTWLVQLGPAIGPMILARLDSPHWYVLRNMLVLLAGVEPWPQGFSPAPYLAHSDARVRREALKLALRVPELRDEGICAGLADADDLILRTALAAVSDGCPLAAVPLLIETLEQRGQAADVRLQVIRVLGTVATPAARDCLIRRALARRRWLPGRRLAPKTPELVAAIGALATRWAPDPAAAEVLRLAAKSADADVRAAGTTR